VFFLFDLFLFTRPNLIEVVQRARPSYNPRGMCSRLAESPAVPSETKLYTQQFLSTREGKESFCVLNCTSRKEKKKVTARFNFALTLFLLNFFLSFFAPPCFSQSICLDSQNLS
jgi:hypothetical protein